MGCRGLVSGRACKLKFRFVDKITQWSANDRICGIKAVSFEEYCLKEAFGDEARLPETLLLESFLQLGNWLILLSSDFQKIGMVIRISEIRFHDFLRPGQRVTMEVKIVRQHEDGIEFAGTGRIGDRDVITGFGCLATLANAEELVGAADMRTLFSEIYQPQTQA